MEISLLIIQNNYPNNDFEQTKCKLYHLLLGRLVDVPG